jgi:hypothetical protein
MGSIHVTGQAERPLRDAFGALGGLMTLANRENWFDGFRIAQLNARLPARRGHPRQVMGNKIPVGNQMTPGQQPGKSYPDTTRLAGFMKVRRQMQPNRFV